MKSVIIDGHELTEADRAALVDALQMYEEVCYGRLDAIGEVLCQEFTTRPDVTSDQRQRIAKVRDLFRQANTMLHGKKDSKARFRSDESVVPIPAVRAYQILGRIVGNPHVVQAAADDIRTQTEMSDSNE